MGTDTQSPELIDLAGVAALLGVGLTTAKAIHRDGRLGPLPIRFGRATRWRRRELVAWLDAGAPRRERWLTLCQATERRTAGAQTFPRLAADAA